MIIFVFLYSAPSSVIYYRFVLNKYFITIINVTNAALWTSAKKGKRNKNRLVSIKEQHKTYHFKVTAHTHTNLKQNWLLFFWKEMKMHKRLKKMPLLIGQDKTMCKFSAVHLFQANKHI